VALATRRRTRLVIAALVLLALAATIDAARWGHMRR